MYRLFVNLLLSHNHVLLFSRFVIFTITLTTEVNKGYVRPKYLLQYNTYIPSTIYICIYKYYNEHLLCLPGFTLVQ